MVILSQTLHMIDTVKFQGYELVRSICLKNAYDLYIENQEEAWFLGWVESEDR